MNKLVSLQQAFQAYLIGEAADFSHLIVETEGLSASDRLGIYADSYTERLHAALADNYPQLRQYTGSHTFGKIAKAYRQTYPSNDHSIRGFGNKLSLFLQEQQRYAKRPVLAELARFEWAVGDTFDAKNSTTLSADDLRNIPPQEWGALKFYFHPSVRHYKFAYNINQMWDALLKKQSKRPVQLKVPQAVLFWRHNLDTLYRPLPPMESYALASMLNGEDFAAVCEGLCQWVTDSEAGVQAATILIKWLSAGLIAQIAPV